MSWLLLIGLCFGAFGEAKDGKPLLNKVQTAMGISSFPKNGHLFKHYQRENHYRANFKWTSIQVSAIADQRASLDIRQRKNGLSVSGFDGKVYWSRSYPHVDMPFQTSFRPEDCRRIWHQQYPLFLLGEVDAYQLSDHTIEGKRLHHLRLSEIGETQPLMDLFIHPETLRIVRVQTFYIHDNLAKLDQDLAFSDYRQIDGVWYPFEITAKGKRLFSITYLEITTRKPLPDHVYQAWSSGELGVVLFDKALEK